MLLILMTKTLLWPKTDVFSQFPHEYLKTAEKLRLAEVAHFYAEKNTFFYIKAIFFGQFQQKWNKTAGNLCCLKCLKITEKISLAVCGSFWWEKHYFDLKAVFCQFHQKSSKTAWKPSLAEYCSFCWKKNFLTQKRCFWSVSSKLLQNAEKLSLTVCGPIW